MKTEEPSSPAKVSDCTFRVVEGNFDIANEKYIEKMFPHAVFIPKHSKRLGSQETRLIFHRMVLGKQRPFRLLLGFNQTFVHACRSISKISVWGVNVFCIYPSESWCISICEVRQSKEDSHVISTVAKSQLYIDFVYIINIGLIPRMKLKSRKSWGRSNLHSKFQPGLLQLMQTKLQHWLPSRPFGTILIFGITVGDYKIGFTLAKCFVNPPSQVAAAQDKANTAFMQRLAQVEATLATRSAPTTPQVPACTTPPVPPASSAKDGESQQMALLMEKLTQLENKICTTTNSDPSKKGPGKEAVETPSHDGTPEDDEDEPNNSGDSSQSEGESALDDPYITTPSGKTVSLMHAH